MSDTLDYLDRQHKRRRIAVAAVLGVVAIAAAVIYVMVPSHCARYCEAACLQEQGNAGRDCSKQDPQVYLGPGVTEEECREAYRATLATDRLGVDKARPAKLEILHELRARHPVIR